MRPTTTPTAWREQVDAVVATCPAPPGRPGFDLHTLIPPPESFDAAVQSVEEAAATFERLAAHLPSELDGVAWEGRDADAFRAELTDVRVPQLAARAADLRTLAGELRSVQDRVRRERVRLAEIERRVREFLAAVAAAFEQARADALAALAAARDAAGGFVAGAAEEVRGGDGSDELARGVAWTGVLADRAGAFIEGIVDFTEGWPWNAHRLPSGPCLAWYDVDEFAATKSGTADAYEQVYVQVGRLQ